MAGVCVAVRQEKVAAMEAELGAELRQVNAVLQQKLPFNDTGNVSLIFAQYDIYHIIS